MKDQHGLHQPVHGQKFPLKFLITQTSCSNWKKKSDKLRLDFKSDIFAFFRKASFLWKKRDFSEIRSHIKTWKMIIQLEKQ